MTNQINKAPAGATHRYEHAGLVSWYREVDGNMFTWRDGSWFASFFKSAQDLAQSCMLGKVTPLVADTAQQVDDDLTWLARNTHKWPDIVPGRAVAAAFVSDSSVRWLEYPPVDWDGCYRKHEWLARRAKLQNKPSWKDAPKWATALTQDSAMEDGLGAWWWHEFAPTECERTWSSQGRAYPAKERGEVLGDWRDTVEQRPVDLSSAAVIKRLDEATQNVLAAVPGLMDEKLKFDRDDWFERGELPPVGTECEYTLGDCGIWYRCKINYVIAGDGVVMLSEAAGEQYCSLHSKQPVTFRPIRTERDVLLSVIVEEMNHYDTDGKLADAILAAGFKRGEA